MKKKYLKLIKSGIKGLLIGGLSSLVTALVAHGLISLVCFYALLAGAGIGFILSIILGLMSHGYGR